MLVEGSQIDWGGHDRNLNYVISEFKEFNKSIQTVLDFAKTHGNTLVIVTADHETGGLAILKGSLKIRRLEDDLPLIITLLQWYLYLVMGLTQIICWYL